jgi:hypothetical protein
VEREEGLPGRDDQPGLGLLLARAPSEPGTAARQIIIEVIALHQEFPAWAVWLPWRDGRWTAVRPASSRAPGPELPMVWLHAATSRELAEGMRRADAQLDGPQTR